MADRCRSFKYQLRPTAKQTYGLERLVVGQRELYNAAFEERPGGPRHTSQRCSACGHTQAANRVTQVVFRCRGCDFHGNADENAAINILRAGLAQREAQAGREERAIA